MVFQQLPAGLLAPGAQQHGKAAQPVGHARLHQVIVQEAQRAKGHQRPQHCVLELKHMAGAAPLQGVQGKRQPVLAAGRRLALPFADQLPQGSGEAQAVRAIAAVRKVNEQEAAFIEQPAQALQVGNEAGAAQGRVAGGDQVEARLDGLVGLQVLADIVHLQDPLRLPAGGLGPLAELLGAVEVQVLHMGFAVRDDGGQEGGDLQAVAGQAGMGQQQAALELQPLRGEDGPLDGAAQEPVEAAGKGAQWLGEAPGAAGRHPFQLLGALVRLVAQMDDFRLAGFQPPVQAGVRRRRLLACGRP